MKKFILAALLSVSPALYSQQEKPPDPAIIAGVDSALAKLVRIKEEIKDLHPYLAHLHPIAIVEGEELYIFDADSTHNTYAFRKKGPSPFPMSKGIRASFPLSTYGNAPTCVVSREVFDELKGYATVFHEFIHCTQYQTIEPRLKERLEVAQQAVRAKEYSWELNHAFPYQDSVFVLSYTSFLEALGKRDKAGVAEARRTLRQRLMKTDFEYMVWEEWKEGFARFIENKVRARLGIEGNLGGKDRPYDRVVFYYGGEKFIDLLVQNDSELSTDMEKLFARMLGE
jgi:hypothetical protein